MFLTTPTPSPSPLETVQPIVADGAIEMFIIVLSVIVIGYCLGVLVPHLIRNAQRRADKRRRSKKSSTD